MIKRVAEAMRKRRMEIIHQPLALIWEDLAEAALKEISSVSATVGPIPQFDSFAINPVGEVKMTRKQRIAAAIRFQDMAYTASAIAQGALVSYANHPGLREYFITSGRLEATSRWQRKAARYHRLAVEAMKHV
jgi:hypothetical protein